MNSKLRPFKPCDSVVKLEQELNDAIEKNRSVCPAQVSYLQHGRTDESKTKPIAKTIHLVKEVHFASCIGSAQSTCRWLRIYDRYNGECVRLLKDMGGHVKEFDECPITSIPDLYHNLSHGTEEHKIAFLHKATNQIVKLLRSSNVTDSWDKTKLDNLLNVLNRQASELRTCVTKGPSRNISKQLKKHFRNLKRCLIKKNYSQSSWAFIRKDVEEQLRRLLHLVYSMLPDY